MENKKPTKELIELKHKVMMQRIDKLYSIYSLLNSGLNNLLYYRLLAKNFADLKKHLKFLDIIKEQYERMYNAVIETGEYEKYQEVEDTIIPKLASIELELDKSIYGSSESYEEIIEGIMRSIKLSKNYHEYINIDEELNKLKALKDLAKLYFPYINAKKQQELTEKISEFKFEILLGKQVEELIYKNGGKNSSLMQYDNEQERQQFIELLRKKIESLKDKSTDEVLKIKPQEMLNDAKLLERLLIIDMKSNSLHYIGLLSAKIFNPHLFHLKNNPFEAEPYFTEERRPFESIMAYAFDVTLKAEKVNYALLVALLKNVITDENLGILRCENLYRRFGFECEPNSYPLSLGQKCVQMIWQEIGGEVRKVEKIKEVGQEKGTKKQKQSQGKGHYFEIDFTCLRFENYANEPTDLFNEILSERKMERKRNRLFSRGSTSQEQAEDIQLKKAKAKCRQWELQEKLGKREDIPEKGTYPLWEKYEEDCKSLGIGVVKIDDNNGGAQFTIGINLDDLQDLPIDYEKVKCLPQIDGALIEEIQRAAEATKEQDEEER